MWTEFEWENKVNIHTKLSSLKQVLEIILKATNMRCLTDLSEVEQLEEGFLSVNLYAQTVFSEDALANLSLEIGVQDFVEGHIRIRSKAQGLALSLGERVTNSTNS